jgi:LysW-gamma-L-lysine carboxypeptidase
VRKAITDQQAVELVHDLVAIPSLSGQEIDAARFLSSTMNELGFASGIDDAGSPVGILGEASAGSSRDIVLLGHIDTVPGAIPVRIENGILHGRGSVDAKGPLAAFVCAASRAAIPEGVRVVVIGAVEEEAATSKGARHAATHYSPAACFIGEPSGVNGVTLGYKGRLLVDVSASTDSAHSAGPSPTAPELVAAWWEAARDLAESMNSGHSRVFDQIQPRLRSFSSSADLHSDHAVAAASFRLPLRTDPHEFEKLLRSLPAADSVTVAFRGAEHAHASDRSDAVARALSVAIRAQGLTPAPKFKTGTSDMNVVAPIWKCPIAAYGPGDSSLDHTSHEHLVLTEYLQSIRVLQTAIETLATELVRPPD